MKNRIFLILALALLIACPQVFAASVDNEDTPGSVLAASSLNFNFSPSVAGMYVTENTSGNEQWYAVSTYHPGGKSFFGSSSDSTSIYKQSREAADVFGDITLPDSPTVNIITPATTDPDTGEPIAAVTGTADEYWLANSWSK